MRKLDYAEKRALYNKTIVSSSFYISRASAGAQAFRAFLFCCVALQVYHPGALPTRCSLALAVDEAAHCSPATFTLNAWP